MTTYTNPTVSDTTTDSACDGATRRHALVGLAVAAGALCAGCSSSGSGGSSGSATTGQPAGGGSTNQSSSAGAPSSSSADGASSSGSAGSSSSSAAGAGGTAIAQVSDIPVGGGKILADKQIVLTQPTAGDIKAFSAVCTHQGCTVASIDKSLITCPCHGSQYKITDGSVVAGPAPRPLAPQRVKVENGQVMLAS